MSEKIAKLESHLQTYRNNLKFAVKSNMKLRVSKNKRLILETEAKIKELGITKSVEINADLREKIDNLNQDINKLQEAKDIVDKEINQKTEKLNKALNPPKTKIESIKEAKIEESEVKMLECVDCGRIFKGDRGLSIHQRTCEVIKPLVN